MATKAASKAQLRELARAFYLLSDGTRLAILKILAGGPTKVAALCDAIGVSQQMVSHHLGILRTSGLVEGARTGQSVEYRTSRAGLTELADALQQLMPSA